MDNTLKRIFEEDKNKIKLGLIRGRHDIPEVEEYLIDGIIEDVTDLRNIRNLIHDKLSSLITYEQVHENLADGTTRPIKDTFQSKEKVYIYVTGLTQVTTTVMLYCLKNNIQLTLMFYNSDAKTYFPQEVDLDELNL